MTLEHVQKSTVVIDAVGPRPRRESRPVFVGKVKVGGGAPVVVQSMCTTPTWDVEATVKQIHELEEVGCEIVRVSCLDDKQARAIGEIKKQVAIPLVADIHFDHRNALIAIDQGVDCCRLNPGNIRDTKKIRAVVAAAKAARIPIRIGVNEGSLPPLSGADELPEGADAKLAGEFLVNRMVKAGMEEIQLLEQEGFYDIKISLKAFDVYAMIEANRRIAKLMPYPLHLGVTEAGTPKPGSIRSAVGIGALLMEGIGDTIRCSLSGDPVEEIDTCFEILRATNVRQKGPTLVACPSCGRAQIDLIGLATKVQERLRTMDKQVKIAVMGCVVNGPGEAKDADLGIAGGKGRAVIFRHGEIFRTVDESEMFDVLMEEAEKL
ncbi:MAG: flavodoxin-dependent (E)-4-hydroxy-3-methylbut-2-enyl-diphosphate synthase [Dehalococcoidia bacterium]|nr:flavodoxin-dependent (E)-4-hydroxy-3-methylbut-2-enyl-diphosphate synthase [Dehalococcoidia bacterium]